MDEDREKPEPKEELPSMEKLIPKQNLTGPTFKSAREAATRAKQPKLDKSEIKEVGNWEIIIIIQ